MLFLTFGVLLCSNLTSGNCTPLPESLQNKRKRKKRGYTASNTRPLPVSVIVVFYLLLLWCFYFLFNFIILPTNHMTLGLLICFFYVEEHLNLCDFQNKTWSLKAQRKWKWKAEPSECVEFSPEKALLYANLSPVPSLYSATCPLLQY